MHSLHRAHGSGQRGIFRTVGLYYYNTVGFQRIGSLLYMALTTITIIYSNTNTWLIVHTHGILNCLYSILE